MNDVGLVIAAAVPALAGGFLLGYLVRARLRRDTPREAALAAERDAALAEYAAYRRQVHGEFEATAGKFRTLNEAYQDLHRQLATSAASLLSAEQPVMIVAPETARLAGDGVEAPGVGSLAAQDDGDTHAADPAGEAIDDEISIRGDAASQAVEAVTNEGIDATPTQDGEVVVKEAVQSTGRTWRDSAR